MPDSIGAGKVLILSGVRGDTRRYRTLHLYEQLRLVGVDCVLSHLTDPHLPEYIRGASVAVLHRVAYDGYVAGLLARLKQQGTLVILDADDFLYDPAIMASINSPDFQDPVRAALYRQELTRHRAALEQCDAITVSTDFLAGLVRPFGKPVRVHRNAYSLEMLALSKKARQNHRRERVIIGYASGTRTHDQDFAMIQPALCGVMERYPQVELWLMGAIDSSQDWGGLQPRVKTFPLVPWRDLPGRLAMLDINLAPLVPDNLFNQSKSEIKFMEAALVGVPTIASRTDAFSYAIQSGQNGFLAGSLEEWQAALEYLINDSEARQAIGETACHEVERRYAPWVRGQAFVQIISELAAQVGKKGPVFSAYVATPQPESLSLDHYSFSAADEAHPSMAELARYSVRHRGVRTLLGQIWVYFRRKLSPVFPFRNTGTP